MTPTPLLIGGKWGFQVSPAILPILQILRPYPAYATFRRGHPSSDLPVKTPDLWKPANRQEAELLDKLDSKRLPHHVAIIMDGNGRWAERRHLPRVAGHQRGVKAAREIIEVMRAPQIAVPDSLCLLARKLDVARKRRWNS